MEAMVDRWYTYKRDNLPMIFMMIFQFRKLIIRGLQFEWLGATLLFWPTSAEFPTPLENTNGESSSPVKGVETEEITEIAEMEDIWKF